MIRNKEKQNKKQEKRKKDKILLLASIIFILVGSAIFAYPIISNYLAEQNHANAIRTYNKSVSNLDKEKIEQEKEKARVYNENLSGDPVHDPFVAGSGYALPTNYTEVLNLSNDGIMATIEIPKIKVKLPIYHGTSEETLANGVGHMQSTSLPIGGNSTHCILTGHTGLPSAELFTKIDMLKENDIFYIHILDETLAYKVYETKVILPNEVDELHIEKGKDLVTLITCTPYGINTHRLLVKASRTEYEPFNQNKEEIINGEIIIKDKYYLIGIGIGLTFLLIFVIIMIIYKHVKKKSHKE